MFTLKRDFTGYMVTAMIIKGYFVILLVTLLVTLFLIEIMRVTSVTSTFLRLI